MFRKNYKRFIKYLSPIFVIFILDFFGVLIHFFEVDFSHYNDYSKEGFNPASSFYNYSFVHNSIQKCVVNDDEYVAGPRLVFIIKSAIGNFDKRAIIRKTWGNEQRYSDVLIHRVFLLGIDSSPELLESVKHEAILNKDIVQGNFIDTYFNNTIKTMLGLRWSIENCKHGQHFMFVDDDYYVSLKNILKFLPKNNYIPSDIIRLNSKRLKQNNDALERLYAGFVFQTAPHRHKFSKWYVPLSEYPFNLWPPYVTAGAYILSRKALVDLYNATNFIEPFRFDDVFLGMAALYANLTLSNCKNFHFYRLHYKGPESYKDVIASHGFGDIAELETVWNECRSAGYA